MSGDIRLPPPGVNNFWYLDRKTEAVIVFVHGIFSDSRGCWLHVDPKDASKNCYWPAMIESDTRLRGASVYMGGYYTAIDAGPYEIRNCADELFRAMNRVDETSGSPVMSRERILFVCHSTGGIVARYLLECNVEQFRTKSIGLLLIASPSYGSAWADRLSWLSRSYNQGLGVQLRWGNWSLRDLDARFKDLINNRALQSFIGVEAYENHFILHRKWLPDRDVVVTEESAGRYFGAPVLLRGTDHFSSVKPTDFKHPAHELLVDFWGKFQQLSPPRFLHLATRWYFKSGITEDELRIRINDHVVSGTRTTTHPKGKVTEYQVTGWNFGITYWLEYHLPTENGGGVILLDEYATEKWSGVVTSKDCDTGVKQCRTNIWFPVATKENHKQDYYMFVGAVTPLATEGFAVEATESFKRVPPTMPKSGA